MLMCLGPAVGLQVPNFQQLAYQSLSLVYPTWTHPGVGQALRAMASAAKFHVKYLFTHTFQEQDREKGPLAVAPSNHRCLLCRCPAPSCSTVMEHTVCTQLLDGKQELQIVQEVCNECFPCTPCSLSNPAHKCSSELCYPD